MIISVFNKDLIWGFEEVLEWLVCECFLDELFSYELKVKLVVKGEWFVKCYLVE